MRASRTKMAAGAVLAGLAFAASGAPAEANARASFGFHGQRVALGEGAARGRFDAFHRHFDHPFGGDRRVWRGRRNGFGGYGFDGYGLGGYGFGDYGSGGDVQPTAGAPQAAPVFLSIYAGPNIYPPPDPTVLYGPPVGPKIIELGRRAPRRVGRPIVIYGDSP